MPSHRLLLVKAPKAGQWLVEWDATTLSVTAPDGQPVLEMPVDQVHRVVDLDDLDADYELHFVTEPAGLRFKRNKPAARDMRELVQKGLREDIEWRESLRHQARRSIVIGLFLFIACGGSFGLYCWWSSWAPDPPAGSWFYYIAWLIRRALIILGGLALAGPVMIIIIFLDNGAFHFLRTGGVAERRAYDDFVARAKPDWYPIAFDVIPTPCMSPAKQRKCFDSTMAANRAYQHDGYVPVIHVCSLLEEYVTALSRIPKLAAKRRIALGGIVPNLLRAPKALSFSRVLESLSHVREEFATKDFHVFGIGGNATIHLAALLGIDSADSSGWRNRAARGLVQLPGTGDRMATNLGKWRGREPSKQEWERLRRCRCPACKAGGFSALKTDGLRGFCHRATHNLWVLLEEAAWVSKHLSGGTYERNYRRRLDNSTYLPLIQQVVTSWGRANVRLAAPG